MSKLREAAEAVVNTFAGDGSLIKAIDALRDALAEPEEDGWRRCAVGQGETQHCALLEAAVVAEREACAAEIEALRIANDAFWKRQEWWNDRMVELEAAVAAEREACARVVEQLGRGHSAPFAEYDCAEAIRARGKQE